MCVCVHGGVLLWMESRSWHTLGRHCTTELFPHPTSPSDFSEGSMLLATQIYKMWGFFWGGGAFTEGPGMVGPLALKML